jgi:hypothetical protein
MGRSENMQANNKVSQSIPYTKVVGRELGSSPLFTRCQLKYNKKLKRQTYVNLSVKKAKNKFEKVNGHGFCSPIQLRIANFLRFI